jgi:HEAT repeat protein
MARIAAFAILASVGLLTASQAAAQTPDITGGVVAPRTLGELVGGASHVVVLEVAQVDRAQNIITFRKTADLKGNGGPTTVRHDIGGATAREHEALLSWARPGRTAIAVQSDGQAMVCVGNSWFMAFENSQGVWDHVSWPSGTVAYAGPVAELREHVAAILAGREVVITATAPAHPLERLSESPLERDWLRGRKGRVWRIKASLKITETYDVQDEESPHFVGWGAVGEEGIPALLTALKDSDANVRAEAACDLGQLGPRAKATVPGLRVALSDEDAHVRAFAAEALLRADPADALGVAALVEALTDGDAAVRLAAAGALADLGAPARPAEGGLRKALTGDRDAAVRTAAAYALGQLALDAPPASRDTREAVAALAKALREDKEKEVRLWAAKALLKCGPGAASASAALGAALRDEESDVAQVAADALARLGPGAAPLLAEALRDPRCKVRRAVACCLGDLGPRARLAIPALLEALKDDRPGLVVDAAGALVRMDRPTAVRSAVPALVGLLGDDGEPSRQRNAMHLLGEIGADAPPRPRRQSAIYSSQRGDTSVGRRFGPWRRSGPAARVASRSCTSRWPTRTLTFA